MLQGIHHVSINVRDVAAATAFYVDVLGMRALPRPDLGFPGAWLDCGGQELHLLGIDGPAPPKQQHFAVAVADIDAAVAAVRAAGVECTDPRDIPGICRQAFTHDPSGNMLEFNQRLGEGA